MRWFRKGEFLGGLLGDLLDNLLGDLVRHLGNVATGDVTGVLVGEKGATASVGLLMFALAFVFGRRLLGGAGGGEWPRLGSSGSGPLERIGGAEGRRMFQAPLARLPAGPWRR